MTGIASSGSLKIFILPWIQSLPDYFTILVVFMNGSTFPFQIPLFNSGEQMQKAGDLEEINSISHGLESVMDFFCQRERYFQPVTATHFRYKAIQLY